MMRVRKEQKDTTAAKLGGKAVAACPKFEGRFALVHAGTGTPAEKVRYTVRRQKGPVTEGQTGGDGRTDAVKTQGAERLTIEVPATVITIDADGKEAGREVEKVVLAQAVSSSDKDAPAFEAVIGDRILLVAHEDPKLDLAPFPHAIVNAKIIYRGDEVPVGAPAGLSVVLRRGAKKVETSVPISREALLLVDGLAVIVAPRRSLRVVPKGGKDPIGKTTILAVEPEKVCKDGAPCTLKFEAVVKERKRRTMVVNMVHFEAVEFPGIVKEVVEKAFKPLSFIKFDWTGKTENAEEAVEFDDTDPDNKIEGMPGIVFILGLKNERICRNKNDPSTCEAVYFATPESLGRIIANDVVHELGHSFGLDHVTDRTNFMWTPEVDPLRAKKVKTYEEKVLIQRTINTSPMSFKPDQYARMLERIDKKREENARPGEVHFE